MNMVILVQHCPFMKVAFSTFFSDLLPSKKDKDRRKGKGRRFSLG